LVSLPVIEEYVGRAVVVVSDQVRGDGLEGDVAAVAGDDRELREPVAAGAVVAAGYQLNLARLQIADVDVLIAVDIVGSQGGQGGEDDEPPAGGDVNILGRVVGLRPIRCYREARSDAGRSVVHKGIHSAVGVVGYQVIGQGNEGYQIAVGRQ